jgi:hypothetical protein
MYSLKDLQLEITAKIEWLKQHNGETLHPDWITQAIMSDHEDIEGKDREFHRCCSRLSVRKEVTQQINKIEPMRRGEINQLTLEGFDYLQEYYVVARDKELVGVRLDRMTDDEIESKALEYESMARACWMHANELRRYRESRRGAA